MKKSVSTFLQPIWRSAGTRRNVTKEPHLPRAASCLSRSQHNGQIHQEFLSVRRRDISETLHESETRQSQINGKSAAVNTNAAGERAFEAGSRAVEEQIPDAQRTLEKGQKKGSPSISGDQLSLPELDQKWQIEWGAMESTKGGFDEDTRRKAYILPMFPYPSGNLHMGHMRVYTIADVLSRWKRMSGYNVLSPMGWDAFGLPAENAAIERGIEPASWTRGNIERMRSLLKSMNTGMDWSKEFATCDPEFYKHTQKLFLLMLQHGFAYQAVGLVNWDPVDQTVLANEQVDKDGFSWRSGAKVEQRSLKQWYLKVTEFKQSLLDDLDFLARDNRWPERVLVQQRNWIGRSEGAKFKFMAGSTTASPFTFRPVEVFTTRPDTLLGVQFLAVSSQHPLVLERISHDSELRSFVQSMPNLPADSKAGFRLKNTIAVNPVVNLTKSPETMKGSIPIFVAPYVLEGYGEGAVMGVPGHDERDHAFWELNASSEPVTKVIGPLHGSSGSTSEKAFTETGTLLPICGKFAGLTSAKAGAQFISQLSLKRLGEKAETWRLRDWLVSRQRYWGTPIPIIHCESCGAVPVPDGDLPVKLPALTGEDFKNKTGNPLEAATAWVNTTCPNCQGQAKRDTDTMDTFVDSSWYFMRFPNSDNADELFSKQHANKFLPVDMYIGGVEHAILHLLYARFVTKFLASIGMWPHGKKLSIRGEPFDKLVTQGMVHGKTYTDPKTGRILRPDELDTTSPQQPRILKTGDAPVLSYEKMSKSKHNGVDPTALMHEHGADVVRAHMLFSAPVIDVLNWDDSKIVGVSRWLNRVWRHVQVTAKQQPVNIAQPVSDVQMSADDKMSWNNVQDLIDGINKAYKTTTLNILVSDLMKLTGELLNNTAESDVLEYHRTSILLRAMAPVTPAFAEECWQVLHVDSRKQHLVTSIFEQPFPKPDKSVAIMQETQTCTVQQNGKLRFSVQIPVLPQGVADVNGWVISQLKATDAGARWFEERGSDWKRVIVVRGGKLVNFVG